MPKKSENGNGAADDLRTMNVYQKMLVAQGLFSYVQKDAPKGLQYSVVTHDAVTKKARAALIATRLYARVDTSEHGQEGNRTWARVRMDIVNVDNPDDYFPVTMFGYGNDSQDKGPGKAISYAVKYCYLKAFGAETGDDADLESVEFEKPKTRAEVGASISDAIRVNNLDMTSVMERIEKTYGEVAEIPLDMMSSILADIEMSPQNWVVDGQPAGVN